MEAYIPVPVEAAKAIAEQYGKSIVIVFSHDPVYDLLHTTTYGTDPQNKAWAAQGGEIATKALGAVVELKTDFEDYRLSQAKALLTALKLAILIGGDVFKTRRSEVDAVHQAVKTAEEFLNV
jgi:hypothetical protein